MLKKNDCGKFNFYLLLPKGESMKIFSNLKKFVLFVLIINFISLYSLFAQQSTTNNKTVKSNKFDTGKMWTFDFPPTQYLKDKYGLALSDDWFTDVRLSALRIPGCTSSFVSPNGLIMTNNHCATWHRDAVQKEGEDLAKTGFYASDLKEERKVPGMFAEQLVFIQDVTDSVNAAINAGKTEKEKIDNKQKKIEELVKNYNEETGLKCQIVSLYNGGRYSIYGYRRYNDVRLVFVPEQRIAAFGGDFDNFTYPRYDLDFSFFRVYDDDGNPLESDNYFKFSDNGAKLGEPIFTVGNPGRTNRLKTVAQLKYNRDVTYKNRAFFLDNYYNILEQLKSKYPKRAKEFEKLRTRIGNGQKVLHYAYRGLINPDLIARKQDFENKIKKAVAANPELQKKYGGVWDAIARTSEELTRYGKKIAAYSQNRFFSSEYFLLAQRILKFADQLKLPEDEREADFKGAQLDSTIESFYPSDFDTVLSKAKLVVQADLIRMNLGNDNPLVQKIMDSKKGEAAADYMISNSLLTNKKSVENLLKEGPEKILNSNDPFIYFIKNTRDKMPELRKLAKEARNTQEVNQNLLGRVIYELYGTTIPPDANFTLRLSDGLIKSFDYNGTKAIVKTTFYGMYDRYYGNNKKYPWDLPKRWATPPVGLDLSTPYNFIATNDIVGGNSGSAVIDKDKRLVGIAFDGNVQSIVGDFIYLPKSNRMIAVASQAILEALNKVYHADRIVKELKTGDLVK